MVGIYSFSPYAKKRATFYAFVWVYPYFHQNWSVFVPISHENFQLYVRYKNGGSLTDWKDIFYEVNCLHQKNRFAGNEGLLMAMGNALRYYSSSVSYISEIEKDDGTNLNFIVLKKLVKGYLVNKGEKNRGDVELLICISPHREPAHYHYYKLRNEQID